VGGARFGSAPLIQRGSRSGICAPRIGPFVCRRCTAWYSPQPKPQPRSSRRRLKRRIPEPQRQRLPHLKCQQIRVRCRKLVKETKVLPEVQPDVIFDHPVMVIAGKGFKRGVKDVITAEPADLTDVCSPICAKCSRVTETLGRPCPTSTDLRFSSQISTTSWPEVCFR